MIVAGNLSLSTNATVVNLPDIGIDVSFSLFASDFNVGYSPIDTTDADKILNATTGDPASGGYSMWTVFRCVDCPPPSGPDRISLDLSGLPTFTISGDDQTREIAILYCAPRLTVETREVRNVGAGSLAVLPDPHKRQGNIHPPQAEFLLGKALKDISDAGPGLGPGGSGLGAQVGASLLFGTQVEAYNISGTDQVTWKPAPLSNITSTYNQYLRSTTKVWLGGALGTSFVPGRISRQVLVFTSSPPHVVASTALLILLSGMIILSYFRKGKGESFTLFSVASSLDRSDLPPKFVRFTEENGQLGPEQLNEAFIISWGKRLVWLRDSILELAPQTYD